MRNNLDPDYLYHYTSIETLALILKHRTIRLNNLSDMDDLEEGETNDFGELGRFIYASSWTNDATESIPLWSLYTPEMNGVRIKLKAYPFDVENRETLAQCNKGIIGIEKENEITFLNNFVELIKVKYTEDKLKIFPKVYTPNEKLKLKSKKVGIYKRKAWEFQQEWRYIIWSVPLKPSKIKENDLEEKGNKILEIIMNESTSYLKYIDLYLADDAFEDMEILCGPKVSAGQKIIIENLKEKYNPSAKILNSVLKIRVGSK